MEQQYSDENSRLIDHSNGYDSFDVYQETSKGFSIWDIIRIILRWWWLIVTIVLVTLLVTGLVVSRITPVYMASSVIEVKQQERQIFDNNSEVQDFTVDDEFFNTQIELLRSDSLASDIIDQFNLLS